MGNETQPTLVPEQLQAIDLYAAGTRCVCVPISLLPFIANLALELAEPIYWSGTPQNVSLISAQLETWATMVMEDDCDNGITNLRINDCTLEMQIGGAWQEVGSLASCFDVPEIRNEVRNIVNNYGDITVVQNLLPSTVVDHPDGCDKDKLFGACTELVTYMNLVIVDFIEGFELATNPSEVVAEMISGLPIIDELGIDVILGWVQEVQNNIGESYTGNYTIGLQDTYRCDLYCLALENCTLSIDDVFAYYRDRLGGGLSWSSWFDVVTFLTLGVWTGEEFCDMLHLLVVSAMKFNNRFGDIIPNLRSFKVILGVGATNPDASHAALCNCPADVWCQYWLGDGSVNGLNIDSGTLIDSPPNSYVAGSVIDVNVNSASEFFVESVTITQSQIGSGLPAVRIYTQSTPGGAWNQLLSGFYDNGTHTFTISDNVYGVRCRTARSYSFALDRFQLDGTGDTPQLSGTKCTE